MNAVNLIPGDRRKRSVGVSTSPITFALIAGLVVVLAAAVLYVFAVNDVRTRKSELVRVTANAAGWQAAANSYKSYMTAAQQRTQQITDIRQLASGRFPWSLLLSQIGGVMPADAALSSLQATPPSAASTTAAASSGTTASTSTSTTAQSAIQLSGCAASQSAVAATMVALRRVDGVGTVSLGSSASSGTASSGSASSGQSSGACPFPVTFQMSLQLATASSPVTSGSATTPATTTPTAAPAATPASSSTATPVASASPPSSGAAQ